MHLHILASPAGGLSSFVRGESFHISTGDDSVHQARPTDTCSDCRSPRVLSTLHACSVCCLIPLHRLNLGMLLLRAVNRLARIRRQDGGCPLQHVQHEEHVPVLLAFTRPTLTSCRFPVAPCPRLEFCELGVRACCVCFRLAPRVLAVPAVWR